MTRGSAYAQQVWAVAAEESFRGRYHSRDDGGFYPPRAVSKKRRVENDKCWHHGRAVCRSDAV
jgi:hypothetical protein